VAAADLEKMFERTGVGRDWAPSAEFSAPVVEELEIYPAFITWGHFIHILIKATLFSSLRLW
jgi:hypothetical protein